LRFTDKQIASWANIKIEGDLLKKGKIKESRLNTFASFPREKRTMMGKKGGTKTRDSGKLLDAAKKARQYFVDHPDEMKKLVSENGKKTFNKLNKEDVQCPKCLKIGPRNSWKRYHFDNCGIPQNPFGHMSKEEMYSARKIGLAKINKKQREEATERAYLAVELARSIYSPRDLIGIRIFAKQCSEAKMNISPYHILENFYFDTPVFEKIPIGVSGKYFKYKLIENEKSK